MAELLLVIFLGVIGLLWTGIGLRALIRSVDRTPYDERVPMRHRRVTHNGFKSRAGIR